MTRPVPIPTTCQLHARQYNADFADAYETLVPKSALTATAIYRAITHQTPAWIDHLMRLRHAVMAPFGIKNHGVLSGVGVEPSVPGQRMGLFEVVSVTPHELVLQDDDKHLVVQLSVLKQIGDATHDKLTLSTVVHIHNTLGRAYMVFVGPAHKVIAPAVMRRAAAAVTQACDNPAHEP
ncbi:MAG TPA: DUF2867 domain-containing protein [Polaromonas sp.]|uniref:DUF2867 domain-containing protein n=1 Tax=Polaromonas sp. TaxID=1869339 RepID=UPI002D61D6BE|nr:DUF2867 domain-containing protein [Polaromonas sp.]HYW58080.1 DUF2867 domain-containing protein [Polaromonas sp.]